MSHHSDDDISAIQATPSPGKLLPQNLAAIERLKTQRYINKIFTSCVVQTSLGMCNNIV